MTNRKSQSGKTSAVLVVLLMLFSPISILSEHACIDGRPNGIRDERKNRLPREWFLVGEKLLIDNSLHSGIRSRHSNNYVAKDQTHGVYCGIIKGVYVTVSNTEFGSWAEFSNIPPKCWKCKATQSDSSEFISGSRLKIGQDKATVAAILRVEIRGDIVEYSFQEKKENKAGLIWHTESLNLEFKSGKLIRFAVSDYSEAAEVSSTEKNEN